MKTTGRFIVAVVVVLLSTAALEAQSPAPARIGGFETQGSVTAGYRFTDISGRQQKYRELFDLRKGFRVTEFDLSGRAAESSNPAADNYSMNVSGLGGDPYPGGQFAMSKKGLYDLRV